LGAEQFVSKRFIGLWSLLAFQAGFINSIGFLACNRFVSHMTGFGTQAGVSLATTDYWMALETLSAPVSFIIGAWFNGAMTIARASRGLVPRYDIISVIMPVMLIVLLVFGVNGYFGSFGNPEEYFSNFYLLSMLTFLCGMQNACFATLTQGQIRTTHLTGISTDIGTDLALLWGGHLTAKQKALAKKRNWMRTFTFFSFGLGAVISAMYDKQLQYWSLLVPVCTSIIVMNIFFRVKLGLDENGVWVEPKKLDWFKRKFPSRYA
jgi:uncharacterized membrane protein YoaK (UPF0700 family)